MKRLWKWLCAPNSSLTEARAKNRTAGKAVAEKLQTARDRGVTVRLSRAALRRLVQEDIS